MENRRRLASVITRASNEAEVTDVVVVDPPPVALRPTTRLTTTQLVDLIQQKQEMSRRDARETARMNTVGPRQVHTIKKK